MENTLHKINLIEYLRLELEVQKNDFVTKLREHVDQGSTSSLSDAFDVFSRSKNEYKGEVNYNSFKIKRKKKFFEANFNTAIANGTYYQKDNTLVIEAEINGFRKIFIFYYLFLIIFYLFFITGFTFFNTDQSGHINLFSTLFIFLHGLFMLSLPYFLMRRSVKRLKRELEREFFYLTK